MSTLPSLSVATQNEELVHDTASRAREPSIWEADPQEVPLKITAYPELSTAAQKLVVGQEMALMVRVESTALVTDQEVPL